MIRSTSAYSFKKIEDVPRSSSLIELRPSIIDEFYIWYCKKHGIKLPEEDDEF